MSGESIHDRVDAVVGDVLALVALAREHERGPLHLAQKTPHERAFSNPGNPLHDRGDGSPLARLGEGTLKGIELVGASYELLGRRLHLR